MSTDTLIPTPTTVEDERKLLELLEEALDQSLDQQQTWLQENCPQTLRERALRLLRAADEVSGENLTQTTLFAAAKVDQLVGTRLGPYHIESLLGEGGMGQVYLARRDNDTFEQTVAVKVIRSAALNSRVVHQFESERQILSDLRHPNIAALLDGGTTDDGLPYVVMEYVDGTTLDAYIEREKLSIDDRLRLFVDICAAVEHAHRALIIHRDIKPGNILVTGEGQPKLLDFGIAKSLAEIRDDGTETVAMLLTPAYASPEQITGDKLTTATDVYSLGVVLFQCLTGERPFDTSGLTPSQHEQLVTQHTPDKPSTRLRHQSDRTWLELKGDLDAIVLRALASDAERRYASVAALSEDITRHLKGYPVLARGDSLGYRAKKFIARRKWLVAAAALTTIALTTSYVITVNQYQVAVAERLRADQRFDQARELARVVFYDVYDDMKDIQGTLNARERIAEVGVNYLNELAADQQAPDDILLDLGAQYTRLSDLYGGIGIANLGDTNTSMELLLKAETALDQLLARHPDHPDALTEMVWVKRLLTNQMLHYQMNTTAAKRYALEGLELVDRGTLATKPRNWALEGRKWNLRSDYLKVLNWETANDEALRVLNEYLLEADDDQLRENLHNYESKIAYMIGLRGELYSDTDQADKAIPDFEVALQHYQGRYNRQPTNSVLMVQVLRFNAFLARMHTRNNSWPQALKYADDGLAIADRLLELDPRDAGSRRNRATQLQVVAGAQSGGGQGVKARATIQEAVEVFRKLSLADVENASARRDHAQALLDAGKIYQVQGIKEAACAYYRHSETVWESLKQDSELTEYDQHSGVEIVAAQKLVVCSN